MCNPSINILKGLAIIFVVIAHSGSPSSLSTFCYMVCCSLFFVASGYCFKIVYLQNKTQYVARRFRRIYVPFVTWSILFLTLNPLLFATGLLNEQYGNASGGVTHPLDLHNWLQGLWSIVFNMSGYDQFICGAYWFFRCLLVASIAYLVCMHFVKKLSFLSHRNYLASLSVALVALCFALWQTSDGLRVTGLAQGGYREFMAIFFIAIGFALHSFDQRFQMALANKEGDEGLLQVFLSEDTEDTSDASAVQTVRVLPSSFHVVNAVIGAAVLYGILQFSTPAMRPSEREPINVLFLALSGVAAFCTIYSVSSLLRRVSMLRTALNYVGAHTLYILGFHLLAFKLISMLKVGVYHLPWKMVGCHPVVHDDQGAWFWMLYTFAGVGIPLLVVWMVGRFKKRYNIHSLTSLLKWMSRNFVKISHTLIRLITATSLWVATTGWRGFKAIVVATWGSLCNFFIRLIATVKAGADVAQDKDESEEPEDDDEEEYDDEEYDDDEEEAEPLAR